MARGIQMTWFRMVFPRQLQRELSSCLVFKPHLLFYLSQGQAALSLSFGTLGKKANIHFHLPHPLHLVTHTNPTFFSDETACCQVPNDGGPSQQPLNYLVFKTKEKVVYKKKAKQKHSQRKRVLKVRESR